MKKLVTGAVAAAALVTGAASFVAMAQTNNPGGFINDYLGDANYGVCRGIDPKCYHNWPRPKTTQYRVLLFTHTAGPRHADLGTAFPANAGMNPALADNNVVQREMLKIAADEGWHLDYTEDLAQMTNLDSYNAVIFFSTSRDNLDDASKTALRHYMMAGGGFVAIHNAFGTEYNWPYYEGLLGGANYLIHGPFRTGDVVMQDSKDVSTKDLPKRWKFKDEWYNLEPFPTHVRFLATVDEKSWDPKEARGNGGFGGPPGGAPGGAPGAAPDGAAPGGAPAAPAPGAAAAPGAAPADATAAAGAPPAGAPGAAAPGAPGGARAGRGGGRGGAPGGGAPRAPSVVGQDPGHGSFHPVAWCQYYDGGKAFMTTLGHDAHDFDNDDTKFPGSVEWRKLVVGGIKSVMGEEPFCK